jgi:hypothetical protein
VVSCGLRATTALATLAGMDFSVVILVDRPIDEVFAAWAQIDRAVEYDHNAVERQQLDSAAVGRGTRFGAIDHGLGRDVAYRIEINAYEPPGRIAAVLSGPLSGGWDTIFEPIGQGTEVRVEVTIHPRGKVGLASPLLRPWLKRRTRAMLRSFREWVESGRAARHSHGQWSGQ